MNAIDSDDDKDLDDIKEHLHKIITYMTKRSIYKGDFVVFHHLKPGICFPITIELQKPISLDDYKKASSH